MMIQAVLGNPHHPEYGVATIPFPIPRDQHAHCMELLEALEIGDAVKADCKVEKIDSFYTVLKRVEMLTVNVEELNYLAKRLDSFDTGEAARFQAMAHKLELFELKDLINLTFCCQQATVITDFSDLAAIGRDHYMNLHGGSASRSSTVPWSLQRIACPPSARRPLRRKLRCIHHGCTKRKSPSD